MDGQVPEKFYATGKQIWQLYPEWAAHHKIKNEEQVIYELH